MLKIVILVQLTRGTQKQEAHLYWIANVLKVTLEIPIMDKTAQVRELVICKL